MDQKGPSKAAQLWKKINEMTARQFLESLPERYIVLFSAGILSVLSALPVLVSLFFRKPVEYLQGVTDAEQFSFSFLVGVQWFQMLLMLGFAAGLVTACVIAKKHYASALAPMFRWAWIKQNLLPTGLLLLLCWSVISTLLSGNWKTCFLGDSYRQEGLLTYVVYALIFVCALQLSGRQMRWVAEILCGTCAVTAILVITGGKLIPGLFYLEEDLRAAMFHQYNHYGYFLAICFPVCFGLAMQDQKIGAVGHVLRLGEFWLICNAIAFNSVRGSFLAILAALAGWNIAVLCAHRKQWKKLLLLDAVFAATILGLNTGSTLLQRMDFLFREVADVQQALPEAGEEALTAAIDNLGTERILLWRLGIQFALDKPVFGHGPDNLRHLYEAYRETIPDRPHNELIQIAASLGFPALAFYVTAIGSHVAAFFRRCKRLSLFQLALFASVGSYLVSSLFGNTMYYTTPYYFMMLAFTYRICKDLETV